MDILDVKINNEIGFIDSHCHLDRVDLSEFNDDFDCMIAHTIKQNVSHLLCVSISLEAFESMYALVQAYDHITCSVGVHPDEVSCQEPSIDLLVELSKRKKVVAIGETGLDYHYQGLDAAAQQRRFEVHLEAAAIVNKPVIIHSREARKDTIELLKAHQKSGVIGVLHCFTENWDMAKQALDLGYYISFSGILTFNNANDLREIAKKMPIDRILIETDSPYLTPVPYRGKKNNPAYVIQVAEKIAELKKCDLALIKQQTSTNFLRLFSAAS